jgi:hypothetical protein
MRNVIILAIHLALATLVGSAAEELTKPGRINVPSADVQKPAPLPVLAKPSPDRASLDDPTVEASNAATPSGTVPARTKPAPFVKMSQPDPFENRKPVAPPVTLTEDVPNTTPRLPKP